MVGRAVVRALERKTKSGETIEVITRTRAELDLTDRAGVAKFFDETKP